MSRMRQVMLTSVSVFFLFVLAVAQEEKPEAWTWGRLKAFFKPPAEFAGKMGDYRDVMTFDDGTKVKTPDDWARRRKEIRAWWDSVMGKWPEVIEKPRMRVLETVHVEDFTRYKVQIEFTKDRLAGDHYLLVPDGKGPFPAVVVVFYDGATSAGMKGKPDTKAFGYDLTKRGFVTLCVGGSLGPRPKDLQPLSHMAYAAANCYQLLANRPDVDASRIGIVGHSFGGKWAMFASCLCDKFACAVWCDPGIVWNEKDPNANYWEPWYLGFDPTLEKQRKEGIPNDDRPRTGAYKKLVEEGHDLHELHALMAPRPFLVSGGAQDRPEHWIALNRTIALNRFLGFEDRVGMTIRRGHTPTPESDAQMYAFFEHFLKPPAADTTEK